ncbi:MAG: alkaline phosphatase family protein [Candidatus Promineifilaceae bacterium]
MNVKNFPDDLVLPLYDGGSIANVPGTVAAMLGVTVDGLRPLLPHLWQPISANLKRVVTFIIDGWGWNLLQKERDTLQPILSRVQVEGQLTSIFPSTTVAALSSLWTGFSPAQHGLIGLNIFMPEYAVTTQMIAFTPTFGKHPDALVEAGLIPETFLAVPGFAQQLQAHGIETHVFKRRELVKTALSQMHGRGVAHDHGAQTVADMVVQMRQLLESRPGEQMYLSGYWSKVDVLEHDYGWDKPSVAAELRAVCHLIETEFLQSLSKEARRDTAVFIVADHGQTNTPPDMHVYLDDHPQLQQMLLMRPSGEPRVPYFHAKHGRIQDIIQYLNTHLAEQMIALDARQALEDGLFGPQPHAPKAAERIGDVVGIMRQGYAFLTPPERKKAHKMLGRHGSLTKDEMIVPWLGMRLDA